MGRPINAAIVQRNHEIARRYSAGGQTLRELADEFGLSKVRVRSILETHGIAVRPERRQGAVERRPKSNILVAMGTRLHFDRMSRGLSLADYAVLIGLSETRLSEALQGLYDWKFSEILRVATAFGLDVGEFVKPGLR